MEPLQGGFFMMEKPQVVYIYDALCGWCYGFSNTILQFAERHQEQLEFHVLSGGMVRGDGVGPVALTKAYIKTAYLDVEARTDVKFGEAFLAEMEKGEESVVFGSEPAARAMAAFRELQPRDAVQFAHRIQHGIYGEGLPPMDPATYDQVAAGLWRGEEPLSVAMESDRARALAAGDFDVVQKWGIQGFPTVVFVHNNHGHMLAHGYTPTEILEERLAEFLKH